MLGKLHMIFHFIVVSTIKASQAMSTLINLGTFLVHIPFEASWDIQMEIKGQSKGCVIILVLMLGGVLISPGGF